ncbi:MAG TPA: HIT family protein [Dongiaceae bacterium]|nr:HIT family protein [Dongiaceae bacterium]
MRQCVFCRIVSGELLAEVIYQDDLVVAIADIYPIRAGHTQVVSRQHVPYFEDLPDATASRIMHVGQRLARAMKGLYGVPRVAFALTGGDHAHVHAHLVPMHEATDITSRRYIAEEKLTFRAMPRATAEELASSATALRAALGSS